MAKAKRVKGINCNAAATVGIKLVLITRFQEMYALREAALIWSDPFQRTSYSQLTERKRYLTRGTKRVKKRGTLLVHLFETCHFV